MAWTYSDWASQATAAAQLARLNLHIGELTDSVGREVDADGKRVSSQAVQALLDRMLSERARLEARAGSAASINGGVSYAGFNRA